MDSLDVRLLNRRIGAKRLSTSIRPLYADKTWVDDLDIVNELGGHTGCVNALSWSMSGNLLASGSDDTYLNIWEYNPANLAKPFTLNTSVQTGHSANIFSVKFMPHSNDRTVVSCAGDSEVRVFDLEYSGGAKGTTTTGTAQASTRSRKFNDFFPSAKWLNESNTNGRVYRSHADRAKRIVTESSPFLFLSCSEDGEVRQWDLRLPSSAYPPPHGARRYARFRTSYNEDNSADVPPPLISYKNYNLDLNSITCSGSQPHYIALGGAHLHCFLHDRRKLGRDISREQGRPPCPMPWPDTREDEIMREQTLCVKRFAPNNKRRMTSRDTGHITACKISDARPNELISSWSGDHIYSFDIVQSPDARDADAGAEATYYQELWRKYSERKRERNKAKTSSGSLGNETAAGRHSPRVAEQRQELGQSAMRVRYENGETVDLPLGVSTEQTATELGSLLSEAQQLGQRIARSLTKLRRQIFSFSSAISEQTAASMEHSTDPTPFTKQFTNALGQAAVLLPQLDEVIRGWSYPVGPDEDEVIFQNTLRANRQSAWRFVQAAGCLCRALGGRVQTVGGINEEAESQFESVKPAIHEGDKIKPQSRFCYDFLRAILLWLDGGPSAVLKGFIKPADYRSNSARYPLDHADTTDTMLDKLQAYLMELADEEKPIIDLGTDRFERDEYRNVFASQQLAVRSFIRALAAIQLRWRHGRSDIGIDVSRDSSTKRTMDKGAAIRFWGLRVGRSLLLEAAEGVTYDKVQQAFGGPTLHLISEEENLGHAPHAISTEEDEPLIEAIDLVTAQHANTDGDRTPAHGTGQDDAVQELQPHPDPAGTSAMQVVRAIDEPALALDEDIDMEASHDYGDEDDDDEDDDDDNDDDDNNDDNDDQESSDDEGHETEDDMEDRPNRLRPFRRSQQRSNVNDDVSYSSHTKVYRGHCNTRTVKDVNFYGLDDEYVVSGSDDGHFFIWDHKTCEIRNILQGDGEVVNVVQGHPYEPIIACSGIDSTVKIFGRGGDSRDRYDAIRGRNIANPGGSVHSSLRFGARGGQARGRDDVETGETVDKTTKSDAPETADGEEPTLAHNGLKSRRALHRLYEITSQNDAMRREGMSDAFMTEGMLARLAAVLQQQGGLQNVGLGQIPGGAGGEGTIVVDQENCSVM